jgi:hypothetical protein
MNRPVVGMAVAAALLSLAATASLASEGLKPSKSKPASVKGKTAEQPAIADSAASLTPAQLEAANRVLTGTAQCEFNQQVALHPIEGRPGHFKLAFRNVSYTMVPEETTTGAVRLEDKRAGVVWVQIPAKSMLLNAKAGQRMVDACQQSQQRASL